MDLPRERPIRSIRRYKTRDRDGGAIGEQFCDFSDAADVLGAVGGGEAKVVVEAETDVVAVEAVGGEGVLQEVLFEGCGDGGFAGGGEAG